MQTKCRPAAPEWERFGVSGNEQVPGREAQKTIRPMGFLASNYLCLILPVRTSDPRVGGSNPFGRASQIEAFFASASFQRGLTTSLTNNQPQDRTENGRLPDRTQNDSVKALRLGQLLRGTRYEEE
jgi:hypothetical protein